MFNVEGRCPERNLETHLNNKDEDSEAPDLEQIPTLIEKTVLLRKVCNEDQKESLSVSLEQLFKKEQLVCSTLEIVLTMQSSKKIIIGLNPVYCIMYYRGKIGIQKYVQLVVLLL